MTNSQNKKGVYRGVLLEDDEYELARSKALKFKNEWVREQAWLSNLIQEKRHWETPIPDDFEPTPAQLKKFRKQFKQEEKRLIKQDLNDLSEMRDFGFNDRLSWQIKKLEDERFAFESQGLKPPSWMMCTRRNLEDLKAQKDQQK